MGQPRFIAFISRESEIEGYRARAPEAEFAFASFSDLGDKAIPVDPGNLDPPIAALRERGPWTGVLNRKEKCLIPAALLAQALGLRPILKEPEIGRDKYRMRQALNGGAEFPRTFLLPNPDAADALPVDLFPCVLKPRFGFNSRSVCRVRSRVELKRVLCRQQMAYRALPKQDGTNADFVAEDLIPGTEHTVESLVKDGEVLFHLVSDKDAMQPPYFVEVGDQMPSRLGEDEQALCRAAVEGALRKMGVENGWTHTEVKLHKGRAVVIEAAARMGGGYFEEMISEVYGIDRMKVLMDLHQGLPLPEAPQPRCHITARRVVSYDVERILNFSNGAKLFANENLRLIWPDSLLKVPRLVVGPPADFNNTIFEFFARGETAEEARALADETERAAKLQRRREVLSSNPGIL